MKITPALKVGLLTIVSLVVLIFGIMWLKGRSISAGERIEVNFNDVDGMRPGSAVQMMGIRIGQIEEVLPVLKPEKSYVKVKFVITQPGTQIPKASEISIQQSGIIGEKFLEITPPKIKTVYLPVQKESQEHIHQDAPVEVPVNGQYLTLGKVKFVEFIDTRVLSFSEQVEINAPYAYKIGYIITTPGIMLPENIKATIIMTNLKDSPSKLRIIPPENYIVQLPEVESNYTIVEPMRLKEFLDLQLKAAKSLNQTNEKINAMMTGETIQDLKITLKNIKSMSEKADDTFDKANLLIETSRVELESMMDLAGKLTDKIGSLTDNVNNIIGDPEFKETFISTTKSFNESTKQVSKLLSDSKAKETLLYVNETAKNISEISSYVNKMTKDEEFQAKFSTTVTNLNTSMQQLSNTLEGVNDITADEDANLKEILNDTAEISKNLKKFSEKLNKRFLLMRLMF